MPMDLTKHPCFNESARKSSARIHLPIAPKCNIQCNYCKRGYDCVNESRPGITSAVLSPGQALAYLEKMVERDPRISVVGIAGPGDPFANATETLETLHRVRQRFPEMLLCVASNGLNLPPYAAEMAELNVSHVTITLNAVDPAIGAKIYGWIRDGAKVYRGVEGAQLLLDRQLQSIAALKSHGVTVKINTIIVPGINDEHVVAVAEKVAALKADIMNCVPLYPVAETPFAEIAQPSHDHVAEIRHKVRELMPIMAHCARCRADAAGLIGEMNGSETVNLLEQSALLPLNPEENRPYVAVATVEGVLVNQHLGEARRLAIYEKQGDAFALIETRATPEAGIGQDRWSTLAKTLSDCRAVLVASVGETPRMALTQSGIRVVMMEGLIEEGLDAVYAGKDVRAPLRAKHRCGSGCAGSGTGCN